MINISADDAKLFEQNGFTREQVGETVQHYREQGLSDDAIQEKMNNRINEFKSVAEPQVEKPSGIDLTPSGLVDKAVNTITAGIETPVRMIKDKQTAKESFKNAYDESVTRQAQIAKNKPFISGSQDLLTDLAVYGAYNPANAVGRIALQGGLPMALESLKAGKNPIGGFVGGSGLAAALQATPYVGKVAKLIPQTGSLIARTVGRVKPETLKRAVQADSKALDLSEKEAQNLLMDTTERIQKDYQQLLDNAGLDVQKAALNLPKERGVFASSLKNSLDDIYNGYSTSGVKELNPAFNNAGDIYEDIAKLIDAGTDEAGVKISAENLNDIMNNLKNYPIDWSKTSAKDRQSILKQIYSDYARRLGNLSPELRKANKAYSKLANFENNEGIRQILKPNKQGDLVNPSSVLRNYNSTVTKGNVNRNIQDLENLLVAEGKQPFINDIDDVNAAMDLLNIRGTGDSWLANLATQATRPVLNVARAYNRSNLPQVVENVKNTISPLAERLLAPAISRGLGRIYFGN